MGVVGIFADKRVRVRVRVAWKRRLFSQKRRRLAAVSTRNLWIHVGNSSHVFSMNLNYLAYERTLMQTEAHTTDEPASQSVSQKSNQSVG